MKNLRVLFKKLWLFEGFLSCPTILYRKNYYNVL